MAKQCYCPWDCDAFIDATKDWNPDEVGGYMRLLCYQWKHGKIPSEVNRLQAIVGMTGTRFWCFWIQDNSVVRPKFPEWQNARMEKARAKTQHDPAGKEGIARFGDVRLPFSLRRPDVLAAVNRWADHSWLAGQVQPMTLTNQLAEFNRRGGAATIEIIERSIRDGATRRPFWEPIGGSAEAQAIDRQKSSQRRATERAKRRKEYSEDRPMSYEDGEDSMRDQLAKRRSELEEASVANEEK